MTSAAFDVLGRTFTVVAEGDTVVRADFDLDVRDDGDLPASIMSAVRDWLNGDCAALDRIAVRQPGTPFLQDVWATMRAIAPGQTSTYGALAASSGAPRGARAVGQACARNAIVLFVPCHRVVAADGIGHYQHGIDFKAALLAHEARSR